MEDKMLKQSIDRLDVSDKILNTLKKNNIKTLGQLCKKEKSDLRKIELEDFEIRIKKRWNRNNDKYIIQREYVVYLYE